MDLGLNKIPFTDLHEVILSTLKAKGISYTEGHLEELGKWYHIFIYSDQRKISLKLPFFDELTKSSSNQYLYYLDLLFKLLASPPLKRFEGTCLFDIFLFSQSNTRQDGLFLLEFSKIDNQNIFYGNDTIVYKNTFFPVFETEHLKNLSHKNKLDIADSFYLFKEVARKRLLDSPIKIDLNELLSIFVSRSALPDPHRLLVETVTSSGYELSELDAILTGLESKHITNSVFFRFPYSSTIEPIIYNEFVQKTKLFDVTFNTRFCYKQIKDSDIVVTHDEKKEAEQIRMFELLDSFEIVNTEHPKEIHLKISALKTDWDLVGFNPYKTPFPGKWFLYIHHGESLSFWIENYRKNFPEVRGSLRDQVDSLISMIYNINWPYTFFNSRSNSTLLLGRSYLFPEVIHSFRNYIKSEFFAQVIDDLDQLKNGKELIILDPLNIVSLVNLTEKISSDIIKVIIPDFILYNYIPFLKYQIAKYLFTALLEGSRSKLDVNYMSTKILWENKKKKLIESCSLELKKYLLKHSINTIEIDTEEANGEVLNGNIEFTSNEIIDIVNEKEQGSALNGNIDISITTVSNKEFKLKPNSNILLQEYGLVFNSRASVLELGAKFLPSSELSKIIDRGALSEKVSSIPDTAKIWRQTLTQKLKTIRDAYEVLQKEGLSIEKSTFYNDYVLNERSVEPTELSLPRSRRDWEIVCNYLSIKESNVAWRNHKCKSDLNKLKKAYSEIIALLINTSSYGINTDENILYKVADLFLTITEYKTEEGEKFDKLKEAKAIVASISKHFDLLEVKNIEILKT